jgi:hypothetical protein
VGSVGVAYTIDGNEAVCSSINDPPWVIECKGTAVLNAFPVFNTPEGFYVEANVSTAFYNPNDEATYPIDVLILYPSVWSAGTTTVTTSSTAPGDFTDPNFYVALDTYGGIYFDINTTALFAPPVTVCGTYPDQNDDGIVDGTETSASGYPGASECNLRMEHNPPSADPTDPDTWEPVTLTTGHPSGVQCPWEGEQELTCPTETGGRYCINTQTNQICGLAWGFSPFVIGIDVGPHPPAITALDATTALQALGQPVTATGAVCDTNLGQTLTVEFNWGDESPVDQREVVSETCGQPIGESHTYAEPGVYTVTMTVTDDEGEFDTGVFEYVVIYDPSGGFVTGGGWIDSPEGAYAVNESLAGKASFGFVSKYKKGANEPTGNTEFQFKVADLNFKSTSYDWLVIAGSKAKFKGEGTINGDGSYGFMLSAVDGDEDTFRIKIWDNGDDVVYDNQMGDGDDADAATTLGGGSIVVHKPKK